MDIMSEIMNENEPGKENPEDLQLLDVSIHNCVGEREREGGREGRMREEGGEDEGGKERGG